MNDTTLLTIIAVAAVFSSIAVIAIALYIIQLGRALVRLEARVSSLIATAEQELQQTLHEVRETTRGMNELTGSGRRLVNHVVATAVISRMAPTAMRAVTGLKTGVDVGRAAMAMYDRWQQKRANDRT